MYLKVVRTLFCKVELITRIDKKHPGHVQIDLSY